MSLLTRAFIALVTWLAIRAGARIRVPRAPARPLRAVPVVVLGEIVSPDRAARLVPTPDRSLEPEVGRTFLAHWALWAAAVLILIFIGALYVRRRWRTRAARLAAMSLDHDVSRK
jgi:hypothetical protein